MARKEYEYLLALGSNQRHRLYGRPETVLKAALGQLQQKGIFIRACSKTIRSSPLGPSNREYANAACLIESALNPLELFSVLKNVEAEFGRRRGQRWSRRVLDLDIIMCSKGVYFNGNPNLCIPHKAMRQRQFVLGPAAEIAPLWRDPVTRKSIRQLLYRLKHPKPLDPKQKRY